jgi:hypothetical protein
MGLVCGRERRKTGNGLTGRRINTYRRSEILAAMDNPVPDPGNVATAWNDNLINEPWKQIGMALTRFAESLRVLARHFQPGGLSAADGFDQAMRGFLKAECEKGELDGGRPAVERQKAGIFVSGHEAGSFRFALIGRDGIQAWCSLRLP